MFGMGTGVALAPRPPASCDGRVISALDVVGLRGVRCDVGSPYASLTLLGRLLQHPSLRAPTMDEPVKAARGGGSEAKL